MKRIIKLLQEKDWKGILAYFKDMPEADRYLYIDQIKELNIERDVMKQDHPAMQNGREAYWKFYETRSEIERCKFYALLCCTRNSKEIQRIEIPGNFLPIRPFSSLVASGFSQPIIDFYTLFPVDYLDKIIKESADQQRAIDFKLLWKLYKLGWVTFDERMFVFTLFDLRGFDNDHIKDVQFMEEHPDMIDLVFLQFHKYEIPVLDLIKAKSINYNNGLSAKAHVYWTEAFKLLLAKNKIPRSLVSDLFQSLLKMWKKPHLDWHVRLLDLMDPTEEEMIQNQATIFLTLGTNQSSLIKFAMECIKRIHQHPDFDASEFMNSLSLSFTNEKSVKSILLGLSILEKLCSKQKPELAYREQLVLSLTMSDAKVQEATASLLMKYFDDVELKEILQPYVPYLKHNTKEILQWKDTDDVTEDIQLQISTEIERTPIIIPESWTELLFQIGKCIHSKSAQDLDVFFEAVIMLQDQIPSDFAKQLKPYTKQLSSKYWEVNVMRDFTLFFQAWTGDTTLIFEPREHDSIPFFREKCLLVFDRIKRKYKIPLLSTPTHEPFYVHPSILIDKLLMYQEHNWDVSFEDLLIACNRILLGEIDQSCAEKAKQIKGKYALAIQYLMGGQDKIEFTAETLPLWTQITRIKHPDAVFSKFSASKAKDIVSVVHPADFDYEIQVEHSESGDYKWVRLILSHEWNYCPYYRKKAQDKKTRFFYNAAPFENANRADFDYQLSANPNYLDTQLCRYVPIYATNNEVSEQEDALYPIKFLLHNQIQVHRAGWIYIASCLLFEKKVSRDLGAEYIELAYSRGFDMSALPTIIGKMIAMNYVPVNRFVEYLNRPTFGSIKQLQFEMLVQCILHFDKEKLPSSGKKIKAFLDDYSKSLAMDIPPLVEQKLVELKWK